MRAWRLHTYGRPTHVLELESVPIPEPEANGSAYLKIPLNVF